MTGVARGWWRRNAWPLAAVAALVPVTFGVIGWQEWDDYFSGHPSRAIVAQPRTSIDYAGAAWGPVEVVELAPLEGFEAPAGSRTLEVTVPVDPGSEPVTCLAPTLHEVGGAERQWDERTYDLGEAYDRGTWNSCAGSGTEPFAIVVPFVVPDDAVGPFALDVVVDGRLPEFLRLPVGP
ncbi:hypothetical protein QFZ26_001861 [Agromyces ramosus]|uniref:Ribosomally synthesized peptide with SipW-like signal peptide n=1 Tax=Agromyces ramosus TaxID=33879 RepID=A0ABU0R895_9MICO|nr:hypothetical protein [Agromyces ramosus]